MNYPATDGRVKGEAVAVSAAMPTKKRREKIEYTGSVQTAKIVNLWGRYSIYPWDVHL